MIIGTSNKQQGTSNKEQETRNKKQRTTIHPVSGKLSILPIGFGSGKEDIGDLQIWIDRIECQSDIISSQAMQ